MANAERGEVMLTVAGASFTLKLDNNALCEFEDATGLEAGEAIGKATRGSVKVARALLWAALRRHHPDFTLADCGNLMDADNQAVAVAIVDALKVAFPQASKAEGKDGGSPRGTRSGATGAKLASKTSASGN